HRRAYRIPFRKFQIITHSDLVTVTNDGRSGQREHQAVCQFQLRTRGQHRSEAAANTAIVELHPFFGSKLCIYEVALFWRQASEIEFVVIPQERSPLAVLGNGLSGTDGFCEWSGIAGCEGVEHVLVHVKVEHHVHAVAFVSKEVRIFLGNHIGFAEQDSVAFTPLKEITDVGEVVVLMCVFSAGTLRFDDEGYRVNTETRHAKL